MLALIAAHNLFKSKSLLSPFDAPTIQKIAISWVTLIVSAVIAIMIAIVVLVDKIRKIIKKEQ
jgi:hypothetical protein